MTVGNYTWVFRNVHKTSRTRHAPLRTQKAAGRRPPNRGLSRRLSACIFVGFVGRFIRRGLPGCTGPAPRYGAALGSASPSANFAMRVKSTTSTVPSSFVSAASRFVPASCALPEIWQAAASRSRTSTVPFAS
jgi:hypothetical protein